MIIICFSSSPHYAYHCLDTVTYLDHECNNILHSLSLTHTQTHTHTHTHTHTYTPRGGAEDLDTEGRREGTAGIPSFDAFVIAGKKRWRVHFVPCDNCLVVFLWQIFEPFAMTHAHTHTHLLLLLLWSPCP